jgi:hypothetical protein
MKILHVRSACCVSLALVFLLASGEVSTQLSARDRSGSEVTGSTDSVEQLLSDQKIEDGEAVQRIFELGSTAVPNLIAALQKGTNVERASRALVYLGSTEERKVLRGLIETEKDPEKKWVMAGFLAGALVEPASREDWDFLRSCLAGYEDETKNYATLSAVIALGINASPKVLDLLQSVAAAPPRHGYENDNAEEARQAIRWIKEKSLVKTSISNEKGSDSERIKKTILQRVFLVAGKVNKVSFDDVSFTENRTRALVSLKVPASNGNPQGYDIVLRKESGVWKIIGAWYTWAA